MALIFQYRGIYVFDPAKVRGLDLNPWKRLRMETVQVID